MVKKPDYFEVQQIMIDSVEAVYLPEIVLAWHSQFYKFTKYIESLKNINIATLGPAGTSSEAAASYLIKSINNKDATYTLFTSYEAAFNSLIEGVANMLLVANAYERIDKIYMSYNSRLLFTFIYETPLYGVAKRIGSTLPENQPLTLATHHAPASIIPWFLSSIGIEYKTLLVSSTSEAAVKTQQGEADLCVTNTNSAQRYGVEFISRMRSINMLWTVFSCPEE